ncbi:MAG: TetR/AcrR family transcriptional regulator [Betaproteobacteria bacterium]|nr:TetR/AcrR family transcriptional regulator [Betaproteobacteria bacterium]
MNDGSGTRAPLPMARPAAKHGKRGDAQRLGRDDWLDAAFDAVVDGGFDQLRVVALAQTLGVTRGSFYWHFADHADLVKVLLARWQQREIAEGLRIQAESSDDPQADLLRLLDLALARGGGDLKNLRFELALRGLGRRDSGVAQMLVEVDAARMALFEAKFLRLTRDAKSATDLAALFYLAVTGGFQALARPNSNARMADYIRSVIADHLIRRQAVAVQSEA